MKKRGLKIFFTKTSFFMNIVVLAFGIGIATLISFQIHRLTGVANNTDIIYLLVIMMISMFTSGYWPGIAACLLSVMCTNYFFTYPYHSFNFMLDGYPFTMAVMLIVSVITSTMTSNMREQASRLARQDKLIAEAEKEKMRANLLRAISHDLRTPLTSIIGASSSYLENTAILDEAKKYELIEHIQQDSNWLLHMVENLLSVTRIKNGNTTHLNKSLEPVEEVVSEAIFRFRKRFPEQAVKVKVPDELIMIPMDAMLIEQVIINLLENAAVHSKSKLPIECLVDQMEQNVMFHIIDSGTGIPPEHLSSIFDGTASPESEVVDGYRGIGIGLSICHTIIVAHGGEISAANNMKTGGAEFVFSLPITPEKENKHHDS